MKKKLFALTLLTLTTSLFAAPISTPTNVSDTPIIGGSNGSCGTVNLSNATSDYMLQPCESAVIRFNNQQYIPLHIAIPEPSSPSQPVIYEITVTVYWTSNKNMVIAFYPNNNAYLSQFQVLGYEHGDNGWTIGPSTTVPYFTDSFLFDVYGGMIDNVPCAAEFKAVYYGRNYPKHMASKAFSNLSLSLNSAIWNNTTTQWISLGTFGMKPYVDNATWYNWLNSSGQIIIKRIS